MATNAVTVQLGAVIAPSFISSFARSDKEVKGLTKSVSNLDRSLRSLFGTTNKVISSQGRLNTALSRTVSSVRAIQSTHKKQEAVALRVTRANTTLGQSNRKLGSSYDSLRAKHQKLIAQLSQRPPGLGAAAARVPLNPSVSNPRPRGGGGGYNRPFDRYNTLRTVGGGMTGVGLSGAAYGAGTLYGLGRVMETGGSYDYALRLMANIGEIDVKEIDQVKKSIFELASVKVTGQGPEALTEAMTSLVSAGRDLKTQALPALRIIGRVATAEGANVADVANMANTFLDNFQMAPTQLNRAFNIATRAGMEGKFELRDMAQYLPTLGGAAASLGMNDMKGLTSLVSALQVQMKVAADPSTGANNLFNLLNKLNSEETKRKFKAQGVDLTSVMAQFKAEGMNPLEAITAATKMATKGNNENIGQLFVDMQARQAITAMIMFEKEYKRVRGVSANTNDVIEQHFQNMAASAKVATEGMRSSFFKLSTVLADRLAPTIISVSAVVDKWTNKLMVLSEKHPKLLSSILATVAGVSAFMVAGGLSLALLGSMASGFGVLGNAIKFTASALHLVPPALAGMAPSGVLASLKGLAIGVGMVFSSITAPVWIAIAAVAALGFAVYKYWEPIKAVALGIGDAFSEAFSPLWLELKPTLIEVWGAVKGLFGGMFGQTKLTEDQFNSFRDVARGVAWFVAGPMAAAYRNLVKVINAVWRATVIMNEVWKDNKETVGPAMSAAVKSAIPFYNLIEALLKNLLKIEAVWEKISSSRVSGAERTTRKTALSVKSRMIDAGAYDTATASYNTSKIAQLVKEGKFSGKELLAFSAYDSEAQSNDNFRNFIRHMATNAAKVNAKGSGAQTNHITHTTEINVTTAPGNEEEMAKKLRKEIEEANRGAESASLRGIYFDHIQPV